MSPGRLQNRGFNPQELLDSWQSIAIAAGSHLQITGLMTMAPQSDSPECTRPVFTRLAQLKQELNDQGQSVELTELSMGMSRDFEIAIEEGATLIRVGSSLFDGLCADTNSNVASSWERSDSHLSQDIDHPVDDRVKRWVRRFEFSNDIVESGRHRLVFNALDVLLLECRHGSRQPLL